MGFQLHQRREYQRTALIDSTIDEIKTPIQICEAQSSKNSDSAKCSQSPSVNSYIEIERLPPKMYQQQKGTTIELVRKWNPEHVEGFVHGNFAVLTFPFSSPSLYDSSSWR